MLWKAFGCAFVSLGLLSMTAVGESESSGKGKCPAGGDACESACASGKCDKTTSEESEATDVVAEKCTKCPASKVAAKKECSHCDKTKVVAEKESKCSKGCDKTKVATTKECTHCDKTKVVAEKEGKCRKGCDKTKVVAEKSGKCCHDCDGSKVVAEKSGKCCKECNGLTGIVDFDCNTCDGALAATEKACTGCAQTLSALERACRVGVAICNAGADGCGACEVAAECGNGPCVGCPQTALAFGGEHPVAVPGIAAPGIVAPRIVPPGFAFLPQPPHPVFVATAPTDRQALLQQKIAQRDQLQREIDQLSAATEAWQQIVVRVKVMEVNLTKMRKLGYDVESQGAFFKKGETTEFDGAVKAAAYTEPTTSESEHKCPPCGAGACKKRVAASIWDSLEDDNVARVLAEPTLVTVSGRPASFNVGGEVPIPAGASSDRACDYVSVGTKLDVLAISLGNNKVRLEIRPRVSEVCEQRSLVVNGQKVPALNVTEVDTGCELAFGETVALTGLTQRRTEARKTEEGVSEETQEIMLVVVVTPEAGEPTASTPRMVRRPTAE
jgi:hypothetical protein